MQKKLLKASMISLAAVAVLSMTGCGSDSSSNSGSTSNGKAVDGYISGARVYLDMDGIAGYNPVNGDISVGITDAKGNYHLKGISQEDMRYAVENRVPLVIEGGIDQDSNASFSGKIKAPFSGDATLITPLTTVAAKYYKEDGIDINDSYNKVAKAFGLGDHNGTMLTKDPVELAKEKNDSKVLAKGMILHQMLTAINTNEDNSTLLAKIENGDTNVSVAGLIKTAFGNTVDNTLFKAFENMETSITKVVDGNYTIIKSAAVIANKISTLNQEGKKPAVNILAAVASLGAKNPENLYKYAQIVVSSDNNLTELRQKITAELKKDNSKNPTKLTFNKIQIVSDSNNSIEAKTISSGNFGQIDLNTTDLSIKEYNLSLEYNITDTLLQTGAKLVITETNNTKYKLTIPVKLLSNDGETLMAQIPEDSNVTFERNDSTTPVLFTLNQDVNLTDNNNSNLVISMKAIADANNSTLFDNTVSAMVKYFTNSNVNLTFDFNNSEVNITNPSISGDLNLTHSIPVFGFSDVNVTSDDNSTQVDVNSSGDGFDPKTIEFSTAMNSATDYNLSFKYSANGVKFAETEATLFVNEVNKSNGSKDEEYNLTIPLTIWSNDGSNLTVKIGDKNITVENNATDPKSAQFKLNNITIVPDANGYLTFNLKDINNSITDSNTSHVEDFNKTLSNIVSADSNWSMTVKFNVNQAWPLGISKLECNTSNISGDFNVTKK